MNTRLIVIFSVLLFCYSAVSTESGFSFESVVISCFEQAADVTYIEDKRDYWQSPDETLGSGKGDCEDKAICLQYLLAGFGIESEVVFGVEEFEGSEKMHAWVEADFCGEPYVLDATNGFICRRRNMPENTYVPLKSYISRTGRDCVNSYYEYIISQEKQISGKYRQIP